MLRRRKDDQLNGKAILQLPERTVKIVQCDFDSEEHSFYMALESKLSTEVDKLMNAGEAQKNFHHILVMLLRLRQGTPTIIIIILLHVLRCKLMYTASSSVACNHPSLVSKDYKADKDAIEPKASPKGDDDGDDELADMFGQMGVSGSRNCQLCRIVYVSSPSHCPWVS